MYDERTLVPGAHTSGLINKEPVPPQSEGPLEEDEAIGYGNGLLPLIFPTLKAFTRLVLIFLGLVIVDAPEPLFPQENTTAIPAASRASRVVL